MHRLSIFMVLALFGGATCGQEQQPKWELGAGIGSQALAHYRGSSDYDIHFLPIPYIVYRGEFLEADEEGIRGLFHQTDQLELTISLAGSLNGFGDENDLRRGMPELDPAGEIGPSINFNLTGKDFTEGWSLRLPVRSVYTFDLGNADIDHIGYLANPQLTYESLNWNGWDGALDLGVLYGSNRYHDYYYKVAPEFANRERPVYEADQGFSGSYFNFSMTKRKGRLWYGGYLRYDNLSGATFTDSPLVETDHYFTLGLGVSWVLRQSRTQVEAEE